MAASPYLCTLWGEQKCSSLQTELKGLMDHTAYLILKKLWTPGGSVSSYLLISFLPPRRVSGPAFDLQRRERQTDRRRRRRRAAASVGFTVATETVSSLLNTCFWWHHMPELSTHNKGFWTRRQATGMCDGVWVWWGRGGGWVVWDNDE